ncbi:DUF4296 domain-containing protein [Polaribacter sp. MED152]|uniref:DUF4296 domain-containing protein n=1 Tax=Polaribacter sp. MED152 TaxID=313598 RepID=UPI000068C51E|nr:DUF4296 domain-containing protein [Polaribacter sp. MED152]EAQ42702.1 hypothetical protein MED152_08270 [Polaribacter sp. MED152]
MKKLSYLLAFLILSSCTSNTIFEKPKDLIPKDTMSLLVQEMMLASSATYIKNKNMERNINYMPLVYDKFKIDSVRFQTSNLYYMSKIDEYKLIFEDAKNSLKEQKDYYDKIKSTKDSLRQDSIKKNNLKKRELDSIAKKLKLTDSIKVKIKTTP